MLQIQKQTYGYHFQYDSLTASIPTNPKKTVDKTLANTGDTITYTVTQNISKATDKDFYYSSLVFKDVLDPNLAYISLAVHDENNQNITSSAGTTTFESSTKTLKYTFSSNYLKNVNYKGQTYKFIIKAKINSSTTSGTINNTVSTIINNTYTLSSNTVSTKINYKVVVHHVDEKGKTLADSETIMGYEKDKYTTKQKTIYGYELTKTPDNSIGTMTENVTIVTYRYKLKDTSVISKYIDEKGKEIADSEIIKGKVFDEYSTKQKEIYGYALIKEPKNATGKMTEEQTTVNYIYRLKATSVIAKYIDEEEKELAISEMIRGKVFDQYNTESKKIYGYELVEMPQNSVGEMTEDIINVIYRYKRKDTSVISKYLDEEGKEIENSEMIQGKVFDEYSTKSKDIYGYELTEEPKNATGKMTEEQITVNYVYRLKDTSVIAKYIDEEGKELVTSETIKGEVFDKYGTESKNIYGYELVEIPSNAKGEMTEDIINVIYRYKRKDTSVISKYLDEEGKEIENSEMIQGKVFDEYSTKSKEIYGYNLIEEPKNATGKMAEEQIVVNYTYKLKETNVIVKYEDEKGTEIADSQMIKGKVFDKYTTEEKEICGYELIKVPENDTGTMTEEPITVTYQYRKLKFNIAVSQKLTGILLNGEQKDISRKLEIDRKMNVDSLKLTYTITVSNDSELDGSTVLFNEIPNGYVALEQDNLDWIIDCKVAYRNIENLVIGEAREFPIVLTATSDEIAGTVVNLVSCKGSTCEPKFEELTLEDNTDIVELIISISTGLTEHLAEIIIGLVVLLTILTIILFRIKKAKKLIIRKGGMQSSNKGEKQ